MIPEEIEPRVSAAIRLLQNEIDETLLCPRATFALDRALLMVTSKALRVYGEGWPGNARATWQSCLACRRGTAAQLPVCRQSGSYRVTLESIANGPLLRLHLSPAFPWDYNDAQTHGAHIGD
jgi:hypothetical protein